MNISYKTPEMDYVTNLRVLGKTSCLTIESGLNTVNTVVSLITNYLLTILGLPQLTHLRRWLPYGNTKVTFLK